MANGGASNKATTCIINAHAHYMISKHSCAQSTVYIHECLHFSGYSQVKPSKCDRMFETCYTFYYVEK
jgi:hypothetical protein